MNAPLPHQASRLQQVDALRGFALLGILAVNIWSFADPYYASPVSNPAYASDLDHLIRWLERDPDGLAEVLVTEPEAELLVVGRGAGAMASMPRRLAETERLVNHTFTLLTGLAPKWQAFNVIISNALE